jgi:hypothetical protein
VLYVVTIHIDVLDVKTIKNTKIYVISRNSAQNTAPLLNVPMIVLVLPPGSPSPYLPACGHESTYMYSALGAKMKYSLKVPSDEN